MFICMSEDARARALAFRRSNWSDFVRPFSGTLGFRRPWGRASYFCSLRIEKTHALYGGEKKRKKKKVKERTNKAIITLIKKERRKEEGAHPNYPEEKRTH